MENKLPVRFKNLTLDLEHPESGIETIKNLTKIYEKEKEEYKKRSLIGQSKKLKTPN